MTVVNLNLIWTANAATDLAFSAMREIIISWHERSPPYRHLISNPPFTIVLWVIGLWVCVWLCSTSIVSQWVNLRSNVTLSHFVLLRLCSFLALSFTQEERWTCRRPIGCANLFDRSESSLPISTSSVVRVVNGRVCERRRCSSITVNQFCMSHTTYRWTLLTCVDSMTRRTSKSELSIHSVDSISVVYAWTGMYSLSTRNVFRGVQYLHSHFEAPPNYTNCSFYNSASEECFFL